MKLAEPRAVAALLRRDKEKLLREWEAQARQLPGADKLDPVALRDHMPLLLDELADELDRPNDQPHQLEAFCAHGEHRLELGIDIGQVIEEYKLLRLCLSRHAEQVGLELAGTVAREVDGIIDEGIKAAVDAFVKRRNDEEAKRREEYLSFVVHDLRSPLSAIYYAVQLIERELQGKAISERAQAIPGTIMRNIERMQALIVKLLQEEQNIRLASNLRVYASMVELWPVAESAIRTLAPLVAGTATQVVNAIPKDLLMLADPELIERVLQNLIANAIEHTPNGTVTVGASADNDGAVKCWVKDTGKGISEDIKARIFEKYQTGRRRRGGLGLGLAVVKGIVDAHRGTIDFESAEDQGTTFRFVIPSH